MAAIDCNELSLTLAQTPSAEKKAEFEVAAIRPAKQDDDHSSDTTKGRFLVHNLTLKRLISRAYDIDMVLISGGPKWVDSDSYDIDAKIPVELAQQTRDKVPLMLQTLLADRFQLVLHSPRAGPNHGICVVAREERAEDGACESGEEGTKIHTRNTHLTAENVTMEAFAKDLSRNRDVGKLVVDKTGLSGRFKFELDWAPERLVSSQEASSDDRPSIFTALQTQLGMRLESSKVPVLAIIVDRAEKPGDN